jgi:hypothetical protein
MINEDAPEHKSEKSHKGLEGRQGRRRGRNRGGITQRARRLEKRRFWLSLEGSCLQLPGSSSSFFSAIDVDDRRPARHALSSGIKIAFKTFVTFFDLRALRVILPTVV